ncbi:hypothetical protein FRB95_012457 [Tulasnella sp. JGI-2019a]|nr:hypothetical protein FRB95_012457 [Tulasnella sp. JGI-2019a]
MVQLRARKARTSYAIQFPPLSDDENQIQSSSADDDHEDGKAQGSTSKRPKRRRVPSRAESEASGSNFSADSKNKPASGESDDVLNNEGGIVLDELFSDGKSDRNDDDESLLEVGAPKDLRRISAGSVAQTKVNTLPGRHERTGPLPHLVNKDNTLRPTPLYARPPGSFNNRRRLLRDPELFGAQAEMGLYGAHSAAEKKDDASRKWSQVVSPGPAWELLEDVSWFKETFMNAGPSGSVTINDTMDMDGVRPKTKDKSLYSMRPLVYQSVRIDPKNVELLDERDSSPSLPTSTPPIICHFGPFDSQTRVEVAPLSSHSLSNHIEDSHSHVFNAGAAVWGLDWCPIEESHAKHRKGTQYLAVGPSMCKDFNPTIGSRVSRPTPACIQIWSMGPSPDDEDNVALKCEMILCVDCGPAQSLKWCPLPSHDPWMDPSTAEDTISLRKLGILGGVFADGSVSFWIIPDPVDMRTQQSSPEDVIKVHLKEPILRIELYEVPFWSLDWANSEMIAVGTTNGIVAVYHIKDHFVKTSAKDSTILPTYFRRVHQSAIRSLAWMKLPPSNGSGQFCHAQDPTIFCSVGYDGQVLFVDIRDEVVNEMARYRDVINSVVFAPWTGGPLWTESEIIKWGSISPTEIGRGHMTMLTVGSVWSLAVSDYHPFLAVGSADGSCQTTNILKVTRQRFNGARVYYKIYQMDYSSKTGEYRMLENFLPIQLIGTRNAANPSKPGKPVGPKKRVPKTANATKDPVGPASSHTTAGWPPEVSVHVVAWNTGNGLTKARLLASGMASGLVRVEELRGWVRDGVLSEAEDAAEADDEVMKGEVR